MKDRLAEHQRLLKEKIKQADSKGDRNAVYAYLELLGQITPKEVAPPPPEQAYIPNYPPKKCKPSFWKKLFR